MRRLHGFSRTRRGRRVSIESVSNVFGSVFRRNYTYKQPEQVFSTISPKAFLRIPQLNHLEKLKGNLKELYSPQSRINTTNYFPAIPCKARIFVFNKLEMAKSNSSKNLLIAFPLKAEAQLREFAREKRLSYAYVIREATFKYLRENGVNITDENTMKQGTRSDLLHTPTRAELAQIKRDNS